MNHTHQSRTFPIVRSHRGLRGGCLLLTLLTLFTQLRVWAQTGSTNNVQESQSGNRYLLVVETSEAMNKRASAVLDIVKKLLTTGMKGQLQSGDTIGLITYNSELQTERVYIQSWTPETSAGVSGRLLKQLTSQPLENRAKFSVVAPVIQKLISSSRFITVILFTDGTQKITGTPFDSEIYASFKKWRSQQKDKSQPFVTVLRANGGVVTHYSVTPAPWQVEFPPQSPEFLEMVKAREAAANAAKTATQTSAPVASPLIVSGKKPERSAETKPGALFFTNSSPRPKVPAPAAVTGLASSNQPAIGGGPQTGTLAPLPGLAAPTTSNSTLRAAPGAASTAVPAPLPPAPEPKPPASTDISSSAQTAVRPASNTVTTQPTIQRAALVEPQPGAAALSGPSTGGTSAPTPAVMLDEGERPAGVKPVTAVTTPSRTAGQPWVLLVGAVVAVVVLCGVAFVLGSRRSRRHQPVSLITESLDRTKRS